MEEQLVRGRVWSVPLTACYYLLLSSSTTRVVWWQWHEYSSLHVVGLWLRFTKVVLLASFFFFFPPPFAGCERWEGSRCVDHPELWSRVVVNAWEKSNWSFYLRRNLPAEFRFWISAITATRDWENCLSWSKRLGVAIDPALSVLLIANKPSSRNSKSLFCCSYGAPFLLQGLAAKERTLLQSDWLQKTHPS